VAIAAATDATTRSHERVTRPTLDREERVEQEDGKEGARHPNLPVFL
jgi:hypothetical protein